MNPSKAQMKVCMSPLLIHGVMETKIIEIPIVYTVRKSLKRDINPPPTDLSTRRQTKE